MNQRRTAKIFITTLIVISLQSVLSYAVCGKVWETKNSLKETIEKTTDVVKTLRSSGTTSSEDKLVALKKLSQSFTLYPMFEREEKSIPEFSPSMATDEAGNIYLVWEHGNEIWWALNEGEGWAQYGKIPQAQGTCPVLSYDEGLLDHGTSPGFLCAWETVTSPSVIMTSIGKITEEGIIWSEPRALTEDEYDDYGVALTMDNHHNPLILWLQRGALREDDTDLYYQGLKLADSMINWFDMLDGQTDESADQPDDVNEHPDEDDEQPDESDGNKPDDPSPPVQTLFKPEALPVWPFGNTNCFVHTYRGGQKIVPRIIPLFGGARTYTIQDAHCISGGLNLQNFLARQYVPILLYSFTIAGTKGQHRNNNLTLFARAETITPVEEYTLKEDETKLVLTTGGAFFQGYLTYPIPSLICGLPVGRTRYGIIAQVGVQGDSISKRNPPIYTDGNDTVPVPDSFPLPGGNTAEFEGTDLVIDLGVGGQGITTAFGGKIKGLSFALGGLYTKFARTASGTTVTHAPFISLTGLGGIFGPWNGLARSYNISYIIDGQETKLLGISRPSDDPNVSLPLFSKNSFKERLLKTSSQILEDNVFIHEELESVKKDFIGTGLKYEGKTVLKDIATDMFNDGFPSVAKGKKGQTLIVWAKGLASAALGSKIYSAEYDGNNWSSPIAITSDTDFNQDAAVVFDSDDVPMAVWSSAANDGLHYIISSVEEIIDAMEKADLMYSRRVQGQWTPPQKLAEVPGRDGQVNLASGPGGEIMAVWINQTKDGSTVFSSLWDGEKWRDRQVISKAVLAESPKVGYMSRIPIAVWAQDPDGSIYTHRDWRIYFSSWNGDVWSSAHPLLPSRPTSD